MVAVNDEVRLEIARMVEQVELRDLEELPAMVLLLVPSQGRTGNAEHRPPP